MNSEKFIKIFAGTMVLISSLLGYFFSIYWLFFTMFVGLNLIQFGFTDFCPAKKIYEKIFD